MILERTERTDIAERLERREMILAFEEKLAKTDGAVFGDSDRAPLKHDFTEGLYIRQIFLPKGTIVTGKIHKHDHPVFLMQGRVSVFTEDKGAVEYIAPALMISPAGTKRVAYAVDDCWWINVHANPQDSRDLVELEAMLIAQSYDELPANVSRRLL